MKLVYFFHTETEFLISGGCAGGAETCFQGQICGTSYYCTPDQSATLKNNVQKPCTLQMCEYGASRINFPAFAYRYQGVEGERNKTGWCKICNEDQFYNRKYVSDHWGIYTTILSQG